MNNERPAISLTDEQYADFMEATKLHHRNLEVAAMGHSLSVRGAVDQSRRAVDAQVEANSKLLSKRETFALAALSGLISCLTQKQLESTAEIEFIAATAFSVADAMMKRVIDDSRQPVMEKL